MVKSIKTVSKKMNKKTLFYHSVLCAALWCSTSFASEYPNNPSNYYTSTDAVENLLKKSKKPFKEQTGINISGDYIFLGMQASQSPAKKETSSGVARLYGIFSPDKLGYHTNGALEFKFEHRHSFTPVSPIDFGLNLGYIGLVQSTYSDQGARVTNLYWNQKLFNNNSSFCIGFLDTTNYVDVYLMASPWDSFGNLVFATGSATIAGLPDGAFGVMLASWLTKQLYVVAGITDANGDAHNILNGLSNMFDNMETFKSLEFGWTPTQKQLFLDNFHITLWQIDKREAADTPSGYGVSFSFVSTSYMKWFSFIRGGWSKDGGTLLKNSLSIGLGYHPKAEGDIFGLGLNRSQPNERTFQDATKTQYTAEIFYNYKPFSHLEITPSLQYLVHPAYNTQTRDIAIGSLRIRAYF